MSRHSRRNHSHKAPSRSKDLSQAVSEMVRANAKNNPGDDAMGPGRGEPATPFDRGNMARMFQYPVNFNLPTAPGAGRINYDITKRFASMYDVMWKCIQIRQNEIVNLDWDIVIKDAHRAENRDKAKSMQPRIDAIKARFRKPDGRRHYQPWLRKGLQDFLVGDYASLSTMRTFGGDVAGWRWIDGSRIKPRIDIAGEIPMSPAIAYEQHLYGTPKYDFFDADDPLDYQAALRGWADGDFYNPDALSAPGELRYRPYAVRNDSPYGFSAVEAFIVHINCALRYQLWESAFWTDGNIPSALIAAPESWTSQQIAEMQVIWDTEIAGNQAAQRSLRWIPGGSVLENVDNALGHAKDFSDFLINITCLAMDVNRSELGMDSVNATANQAGAMQSQHQRHSLIPTANWLKAEFFDPILEHDLKEPDLEWVWPAFKLAFAREQAEVNKILIHSAQKAVDEVIVENGGTPLGIGHMLVTGAQVLMQQDLIDGTKHGIGAIIPGTASFAAPQPLHKPLDPGQASGRAPQPENRTSTGNARQAKAADLRRWRDKSVKAVRLGKSADVLFSTDMIPMPVYHEVRALLVKAEGESAVRNTFEDYLDHLKHCPHCEEAAICDAWASP